MIKQILTFTLFTSFFFSYGQDELKVSKKKENTRNGKANYYVLKSDETIKHGRYTIVAWTGNEKLVDGNYSLGKKQGLWTEKYYGVGNKNGSKSYGHYKDDLKIGRWTYFSVAGDTSQIYDYSTNELIFSNECNTKRQYNTKTENGYKWIKLDCPPIFKGGKDILNTDLSQHISYYPTQLKAIGMHTFEINTEVILTIDTNGKVSSIKFSKEIGYRYEEKIEKWIMEMGNDWIPGRLNGQLVETQVELPLRQKFQF